MIAMAVSIPVIGVCWTIIEEQVIYGMVENCISKLQTLRAILCSKALRMTNATNSEFASGEIFQVINSDVEKIWQLMFDGVGCIECPLRILFASFIVIQ